MNTFIEYKLMSIVADRIVCNLEFIGVSTENW